jgi:predicted dehydrogenase
MDNRSEKIVRLVIVGCGSAARNIHIPRLLALPNLFQVVAVCDIDPAAAQSVSGMLGDVPWFENQRRMLESIPADAMLVLTPLHYEPSVLGLEYGLDLFVEKPFCETPEQALKLAEQVSTANKVAMVGAMRIFEPGVMAVRERLASLAPLRWVEIHDFCSRGAKEGAPKWAGVDPRLVDRTLQAALQGFNPNTEPRMLNALQTVLLEFIHDLSILRAIFGGPTGCADAHISRDGWSIAGRLSLPGEVPCNFEVAEFGVSRTPVEEVSLTIAGEGGLLRIEFGNPFVQGGGECTIFQSGMPSERMRGDPYQEELLAFHRAIIEGVSKWNDAKAGAADVVAAWNIVEKGIINEL